MKENRHSPALRFNCRMFHGMTLSQDKHVHNSLYYIPVTIQSDRFRLVEIAAPRVQPCESGRLGPDQGIPRTDLKEFQSRQIKALAITFDPRIFALPGQLKMATHLLPQISTRGVAILRVQSRAGRTGKSLTVKGGHLLTSCWSISKEGV